MYSYFQNYGNIKSERRKSQMSLEHRCLWVRVEFLLEGTRGLSEKAFTLAQNAAGDRVVDADHDIKPTCQAHQIRGQYQGQKDGDQSDGDHGDLLDDAVLGLEAFKRIEVERVALAPGFQVQQHKNPEHGGIACAINNKKSAGFCRVDAAVATEKSGKEKFQRIDVEEYKEQ